MILCKDNQEKEILEYIGNDYAKCTYLYIDFRKYGMTNENVHVWCQRDGNDKICALVLQYYLGMHVYSREGNFDPADIAKLIAERKPTLVCGMKETIDKIAPFIEGYDPEYGKVLRLGEYSGIAGPEVRRAERSEIREIAELLATDEEMGGPYGFEALYNQLLGRFDEGFGRNWVRKDEKGVVSHCATYAELDDVAVISGGIVRMDYRGKGEYPGQLGAMCRDLYNEGKEVISYYYGGAKTAHKVVGFDILGDWAKLILRESEK